MIKTIFKNVSFDRFSMQVSVKYCEWASLAPPVFLNQLLWQLITNGWSTSNQLSVLFQSQEKTVFSFEFIEVSINQYE